MPRPSIGEVRTIAEERTKEKRIDRLTVLEKEDDQSLYYLLFEKTKTKDLESKNG